MNNEQIEAIKTIKLEKLGLLLIKYCAYLGLFTTKVWNTLWEKDYVSNPQLKLLKYEELDKDNRQMKIASLLNFKNFGGTRISKDK